MADSSGGPSGPDLTKGVAESDLAEGEMLGGHVGDDAVVVARLDGEVHAIGGKCTHYGGPLAEGLLVGEQVRCPWHHACFSLKTGEALKAPAFDPVTRWRVERREGVIFVREKIAAPDRASSASGKPERIVIIGGGAAGFAAAEMLRRQGFGGSITMVSDDRAPPVDRPNLSKDFLAGKAPESWMPLRDAAFYRDHAIELLLGAKATAIDTGNRRVTLAGGSDLAYDRLLLATGAEPRKLEVPGADLPHVFTLRTFDDCLAIIAAAGKTSSAVVVGASFIGLEVAASLRERGLTVAVVAPEALPLAGILGPELGAFVKSLHEEHGVVFHLEDAVAEINLTGVRTRGGLSLACGLVVAGIGVTPRTGLAKAAGLAVDNGVTVDEFLETSVPGIFAAGDIASWPYRPAGHRIRIEHWVVAERQGQCTALNMLGRRKPFDEVPFFWSQHYDVPINYVGTSPQWERDIIEGDVAGRDCLVRYAAGGRVAAVATIYRDKASLEAERDLERETA